MDQKKINRINELAHKQKGEGLTPEEKQEQANLRQEYILAIRGSLKSVMKNIDILEPDGSVTQMAKVIEAKDKGRN